MRVVNVNTHAIGTINFSDEFKTNLVLQLLKGEKELNVHAVENDIQPNLLRNWKKEFLTNASLAFNNKREDNLREKLAEERKEKAEYAKKVGQLTMQVDWLKKNLKKLTDLFGVFGFFLAFFGKFFPEIVFPLIIECERSISKEFFLPVAEEIWLNIVFNSKDIKFFFSFKQLEYEVDFKLRH